MQAIELPPVGVLSEEIQRARAARDREEQSDRQNTELGQDRAAKLAACMAKRGFIAVP
jgi:hypothetical protein